MLVILKRVVNVSTALYSKCVANSRKKIIRGKYQPPYISTTTLLKVLGAPYTIIDCTATTDCALVFYFYYKSTKQIHACIIIHGVDSPVTVLTHAQRVECVDSLRSAALLACTAGVIGLNWNCTSSLVLVILCMWLFCRYIFDLVCNLKHHSYLYGCNKAGKQFREKENGCLVACLVSESTKPQTDVDLSFASIIY